MSFGFEASAEFFVFFYLLAYKRSFIPIITLVIKLKKPWLLLFLICLLSVLVGFVFYLAVNSPKISTKARLVKQVLLQQEKGGGVLIDSSQNCGIGGGFAG